MAKKLKKKEEIAKPPRTIAYVIAQHRDHIITKIATQKESIGDFASSLLDDPTHALEWSSGAFKIAATLWVYKDLLRLYDRVIASNVGDSQKKQEITESLNRAYFSFTEDALRLAKYPPRSTSVQSNFMEQEKAAAKVEALDVITFWIRDLSTTTEAEQ